MIVRKSSLDIGIIGDQSKIQLVSGERNCEEWDEKKCITQREIQSFLAWKIARLLYSMVLGAERYRFLSFVSEESCCYVFLTINRSDRPNLYIFIKQTWWRRSFSNSSNHPLVYPINFNENNLYETRFIFLPEQIIFFENWTRINEESCCYVFLTINRLDRPNLYIFIKQTRWRRSFSNF